MTPCTCHPGNVCASAASCAAARRVEFGDDMTTTQADALPEPELGYIKTDKSNQPAFSARQMRAALQAQPAATTKVGAPSGMLRTTCPYCENGFAFEQPAAAGVSDADLYGTLEPTIVSRYVVEKRVGGGFWGYCVKAGDGAQEIFVGHKNACEHVRQALQTACLDGAYMAHEKARAILALRPQAVPMTDEQAKQFLKQSDLLDMFLHIGWYSAPRKGFDQHALSLIRAVEAHHGITAQAGEEQA